MADPPLVSIVTPVLDGERYLGECLESVRAQQHVRLEHIVVDGGSRDRTPQILASFPGLRVLSGPDHGMYDALRRGFEAARGAVFAYQNADDRYADPGAVAAAVEFLERRPEVDLVYGDFRWIDPHGRPLGPDPARRPPRRQDAILRHNYIPPHATFVRARLVRDEGLGPDPAWQYAGDWEWYLRLHLAGKHFAHLPRVLAEFRVHGGSKTARLRLGSKLAEWRRICRRHRLSFARLLWNELLWMPSAYRRRR